MSTMIRMLFVLAAAGPLVGGGAIAGATEIHVPGDAATIQEAIDAAGPGDVISIDPGVYPESLVIDKDLSLVGAGPAATVIDPSTAAGGPGGRGASVVGDVSVEIVGLAFRNGAVDLFGGGVRVDEGDISLSDCAFQGNVARELGGGLHVGTGSATVSDCVFDGNRADGGAGMHAGGSATISGTLFTGNRAANIGGAGLNISGGDATVTGSTFEGNRIGAYGGVGAGMRVASGTAAVESCDFIGNVASGSTDDYGRGGGLGAEDSEVTVSRTAFRNNTASAGSEGFASGGGVYLLNSTTALTNCVFAGNAARTYVVDGGGASVRGGSATFTHVTFNGNSVRGVISAAGGGLFAGGAAVTVVNSILWGDTGGEIAGAATVQFSDVQGGAAGAGNISRDPLFVDAASGDLHLRRGSPAIHAGTADPGLVTLPVTDLDGLPRILGRAPDMGAYEAPVPLRIWPPNHRPVSVSLDACVRGTLSAPAELTDARITRVTSDEPEDAAGNGDGCTCNDIMITGPASVDLRAERAGAGDGRVYAVSFSLLDPAGVERALRCTVEVSRSGPLWPAYEGAPALCAGEGCGSIPQHDPSCTD